MMHPMITKIRRWYLEKFINIEPVAIIYKCWIENFEIFVVYVFKHKFGVFDCRSLTILRSLTIFGPPQRI